jgi:hypothetical protein
MILLCYLLCDIYCGMLCHDLICCAVLCCALMYALLCCVVLCCALMYAVLCSAGEGLYTQSGSGDTYRGEYHLDKKHGFGRFESEEGTYEVRSLPPSLPLSPSLTHSLYPICIFLKPNIYPNYHSLTPCSCLLSPHALHRRQGHWKAGKRHGQARVVYRGSSGSGGSGDEYEGEMRNDLRHGEGRFLFSNGDEYSGHWRDHKKDGR